MGTAVIGVGAAVVVVAGAAVVGAVVDTTVVVGAVVGGAVVGGMVVVVVVVGATVVDVVVVDVLVTGLVDVVVLDVGVATTPVDCPDDASLPSSWRNDTTTVTQYAPGSANVIGSETVALAPSEPPIAASPPHVPAAQVAPVGDHPAPSTKGALAVNGSPAATAAGATMAPTTGAGAMTARVIDADRPHT